MSALVRMGVIRIRPSDLGILQAIECIVASDRSAHPGCSPANVWRIGRPGSDTGVGNAFRGWGHQEGTHPAEPGLQNQEWLEIS
jgi:hypothetical protein